MSYYNLYYDPNRGKISVYQRSEPGTSISMKGGPSMADDFARHLERNPDRPFYIENIPTMYYNEIETAFARRNFQKANQRITINRFADNWQELDNLINEAKRQEQGLGGRRKRTRRARSRKYRKSRKLKRF